MANNKEPLKIASHSFKPAVAEAVSQYFQGPCQGMAVVATDPAQADADMYDANAVASRILLEERLEQKPAKPIIVIALQDYQKTGVLLVKKPFKTNEMMAALNQVRQLNGSAQTAKEPLSPQPQQTDSASPAENHSQAKKPNL